MHYPIILRDDSTEPVVVSTLATCLNLFFKKIILHPCFYLDIKPPPPHDLPPWDAANHTYKISPQADIGRK